MCKHIIYKKMYRTFDNFISHFIIKNEKKKKIISPREKKKALMTLWFYFWKTDFSPLHMTKINLLSYHYLHSMLG